MNKINYKEVLMDLMTDQPLKEPTYKLNEKGEYVFDKEVLLTVERACLAALNYKDEGFANLSHDVIDKRYSLIKKVKKHEQNLSSEEKTVIIVLARKALSVQMSGQIIDILG